MARSTHVQCEVVAGLKHHNSSPPAGACNKVTNKVLKIEIKHNTLIEISTVLMVGLYADATLSQV